MIKKINLPTLIAVFGVLWAVNNVAVLAPAKNVLYKGV